MENLPAVRTQQPQAQQPQALAPQSAFSSPATFEAAQRMALALCTSTLVPTAFQGKENIGNTLIALEMAQRVGASPMAVMQNLHVIHGRPSWSASFIIAALNSCGKFSPLRFKIEGDGDKRVCTAWAYDKGTGEVIDGPPTSIAMAKAEGWESKSGSKWKTMPDLMLRYRAAAFFGRLYAPEILMGMHTEDEAQDMSATGAPVLVEPVTQAPTQAKPAESAVVEAEPAEAKPQRKPKPKPDTAKPEPKPAADPPPEPAQAKPTAPALVNPGPVDTLAESVRPPDEQPLPDEPEEADEEGEGDFF
jgi:hypothetical protein